MYSCRAPPPLPAGFQVKSKEPWLQALPCVGSRLCALLLIQGFALQPRDKYDGSSGQPGMAQAGLWSSRTFSAFPKMLIVKILSLHSECGQSSLSWRPWRMCLLLYINRILAFSLRPYSLVPLVVQNLASIYRWFTSPWSHFVLKKCTLKTAAMSSLELM